MAEHQGIDAMDTAVPQKGQDHRGTCLEPGAVARSRVEHQDVMRGLHYGGQALPHVQQGEVEFTVCDAATAGGQQQGEAQEHSQVPAGHA